MKIHPVTFAVLIAQAVVFLSGCRTIENPMTVPEGQRDMEVYASGMERSRRLRETQYSMDVFVDCDNVVLNSSGNQMSAVEARALLASQIDGVLRSKLQKFPFFRVTAGDSLMNKVRQRRMSNDVESGLPPMLEQRERADYAVLARIDSVYSHGDGSIPTSGAIGGSSIVAGAVVEDSPKASTIGGMIPSLATALEPNIVEISMTFELYDNNKGKTVHTEHIDRDSSGLAHHNTGAAILKAARDCISDYCNIIARDYTQENRVLSTRGDGKYAWISLGSKEGIAAGDYVMYYEFADAGDIIESWDHVEKPVAYGVVIGVPDEHTSWTRVEQYSSVAVRKFHYVKVIAVPDKKDGILGRLGLGL